MELGHDEIRSGAVSTVQELSGEYTLELSSDESAQAARSILSKDQQTRFLSESTARIGDDVVVDDD